MLFLITLLALPVLIKLFTNLGLLKLRLLPKSAITAEMIIEDMNKRKIRPLKVEMKYNYTYKLFHDRLKEGEITRDRILAMRHYLDKNVHQYPHKKFCNDAHAIYTMLQAKDITVKNLDVVQSLVSTVNRQVDSNWINVASILNN